MAGPSKAWSHATATEPLLAQPEAVAVVNQHFDCGRSAVVEYKGATTEWILSQYLPAKSSESIDAPAEINRIDRDQDAHLWRNGKHSPSLRLQKGVSDPLPVQECPIAHSHTQEGSILLLNLNQATRTRLMLGCGAYQPKVDESIALKKNIRHWFTAPPLKPAPSIT
jgi:hypothetical protein